MSASSTPDQRPSVQTQQHVARRELACGAVTLMSGNGASPPRQHSTKLRIGWPRISLLSDQAFAQQQLDVAVVARALVIAPPRS